MIQLCSPLVWSRSRTSFRSIPFYFYVLYCVGVALRNKTPNRLLVFSLRPAFFMVAMPTTGFSPIDGRSSQSASSWAGVCAHTENCLVHFYYYDQTAQGACKCRTCWRDWRWKMYYKRCAENSIQVMNYPVFLTTLCNMNIIQKLAPNTELMLDYWKISSWSCMAVLNWTWQH